MSRRCSAFGWPDGAKATRMFRSDLLFRSFPTVREATTVRNQKTKERAPATLLSFHVDNLVNAYSRLVDGQVTILYLVCDDGLPTSEKRYGTFSFCFFSFF